MAYIADDGSGTASNGGIEKWTYSGSTWSQAYVLRATSSTYYRGLAGEMDPATGLITLFATTAPSSGQDALQQVTDTGSGSTFTTLATAPTNYVFRGVALAPAPTATPEPGTLALLVAAVAGLLAYAWRRRNG